MTTDQPNKIDALIKNARMCYNKQEYKNAINLLTFVINHNPSNHLAYFILGKSYYSFRDYGMAIESFSKAIMLLPNNYNYYRYRAYAHFAINNYKDALNDINTSLSINSSVNESMYLKDVIMAEMSQIKR